MHGFLIVGTNEKKKQEKIEKLAEGRDLVNFELQKIEHSRELKKATRFKTNRKKIFVLENIDQATEEALNAILKILEEPGENYKFILTAKSANKLLPTIKSRLEIINVGQKGPSKIALEKINKFLNASTNKKLKMIENIKDRNEAMAVLETIIFLLHKRLEKKPKKNSEIILEAQRTLSRIKANANTNLQLTNFVIKLDKG